MKGVGNQGTTLVKDVDGEGGYASVGTGVTWETSVSACQFYCETKTALKRGLIKKNSRYQKSSPEYLTLKRSMREILAKESY